VPNAEAYGRRKRRGAEGAIMTIKVNADNPLTGFLVDFPDRA
jgi:hypothetical protein